MVIVYCSVHKYVLGHKRNTAGVLNYFLNIGLNKDSAQFCYNLYIYLHSALYVYDPMQRGKFRVELINSQVAGK